MTTSSAYTASTSGSNDTTDGLTDISDMWTRLATIGSKEITAKYLQGCAALWMRLGFHPILLWGLRDDGSCGCGYTATTDELEAVHEGRRKGHACGKHPMDHGWQTERLDEANKAILLERIEEGFRPEWRKLRGLPNLGLRMGKQPDGRCVVAIDDDGDLSDLQSEYGQLPETLTTRSGSGGRHLIYEVPADVELDNRVGIRSRANPDKVYRVDIRTEGGQIVVAPSLHKSGNRYGIQKARPPVQLPDEFVELLRTKRVKTQGPTVSAPPVDYDSDLGRITRRAEQYVAKMPPSISGEGGHTRLLTVARVLRWDFNLPDSDAWRILCEYNLRGDPETEAQLKHKFEDALKDFAGRNPQQGHLAASGSRGRPPKPLPTDEELMALAGDMLDDYEPEADVSDSPTISAETVDAPESATPRRPCTDLGNGERLRDLFGTEILYVEPTKTWYVWDGTRFRSSTDVAIQQYAKRVARGIYAEAARCDDPSRKRELCTWAKKSEDAARIAAMIRLVRDAVRIEPDELDNQPWLLNCPNGVVDLRTGALLPHDPQYRLTQITRFPYDPTVQSPLLKSHLEKCQPNPEMRAYLARSIGYAATGVIREHMYEFHTGAGRQDKEGRNGKGTFLHSIQWALGDYAGYPPTDLFIMEGGRDQRGHPTGFMTLRKKRFSVVGECQRGDVLNSSNVKRCTGGDPVNGRNLYKDYAEDFQPTHHLHQETNYLPRVTSIDAATWDRIRVIPWSVYLPPEERQEDYREKLYAEGTGILTWVVQGCLAWQAAGCRTLPPAAVMEATRAYQDGEDDLGQFLAECTEPSAESRLSSEEMYQLYTSWCDAGGKHALAKTSLGKALRQRGLEQAKSNGLKYWVGLRSLGTEETRATMAAYAADSQLYVLEDTPENDAEVERMLSAASGDEDDSSSFH